jgi:hypothetical protein
MARRKKGMQQFFRDPVGEERSVGRHRGNCLEQVCIRIRFEEVASRSGPQEV